MFPSSPWYSVVWCYCSLPKKDAQVWHGHVECVAEGEQETSHCHRTLSKWGWCIQTPVRLSLALWSWGKDYFLRPSWMEPWAIWSCVWHPCPWWGGWNEIIFMVPSTPRHLVILWSCDTTPATLDMKNKEPWCHHNTSLLLTANTQTQFSGNSCRLLCATVNGSDSMPSKCSSQGQCHSPTSQQVMLRCAQPSSTSVAGQISYMCRYLCNHFQAAPVSPFQMEKLRVLTA